MNILADCDWEKEGDETIILKVTGGNYCDESGSGEINPDGSATLTIDDDDEWEVVVKTPTAQETGRGYDEAGEGSPCVDGQYIVQRVAAGNEPMDRSYDIHIDYTYYYPPGAEEDGVYYAKVGDDFTDPNSGTLTLVAPPTGCSATSLTVPITVINDTYAEEKETVLAILIA